MPNIYLKVTVEKKSRTQNFDLLSLKKVRRNVGYHWIFKLLVAT